MTAPLTTGFVTPTLEEVEARVLGDLSQLPGAAPLVKGQDAWFLGKVSAGAAWLQHKYLDAMLRELHVLTATALNLPRLGAMWGVAQNQPTAARYYVKITVTDTQTIPAETLLLSASGIEYLTDEELVITGAGHDYVAATCQTAGTVGNLEHDAPLTFAVTIPNVSGDALAASVISEGTDLEDLEAYRARIVQRIQIVPCAGTLADHQTWALSVDGVERAWPSKPADGSVMVVVDPGSKSGDVQTYVDSVRPISGEFTAVAAVEEHVEAEIDGYLDDGADATTVKAAIVAALNAKYHLCAPGGTVHNSTARKAIGGVSGLAWFEMSSFNGGGPLEDYTSVSPKIPVVEDADITWGGDLA